jgi:hypothetical protein
MNHSLTNLTEEIVFHRLIIQFQSKIHKNYSMIKRFPIPIILLLVQLVRKTTSNCAIVTQSFRSINHSGGIPHICWWLMRNLSTTTTSNECVDILNAQTIFAQNRSPMRHDNVHESDDAYHRVSIPVLPNGEIIARMTFQNTHNEQNSDIPDLDRIFCISILS